MAPIRVLVVDDHALVRAGFHSILSGEADIEVVGEATDGEEAVALAVREIPDVVLMDIRMPGMDGLQATRLITADPRLRGTSVVVLTTFDLDEYVFGALRAGASGFLLKGVEPAALIEAVRTVARGDALRSREPPAGSSRRTWATSRLRPRRGSWCRRRSRPARSRFSGSSPPG